MFELSDGGAPYPVLSALARAFGGRLAEAAATPALLAAVDQHAACVRDGLGAGAGLLEPEDLADYVLGFADALSEMGWSEPPGYDFATERLTAVCWLAGEHGMLDETDPARRR